VSGALMNTYGRLPAEFERGEGCWLFGGGRRYLDFSSGIAVNCLGHGYPPLARAVAEQAAKCMHLCNYYGSATSRAFAERLVAACSGGGMKSAFLANSGAEANEAAIKIARKYSLKRHGPGRHRIVALQGSFHGRTITALSATGQEKFHRDFGPFTEGFSFVPPGDVAALEKALDGKAVAGFMLEDVQGESGVRPQAPEYVEAAARLCAERDILLMFDEVQCGVGRTGAFLSFERHRPGGAPLKADIVTLAKGLGGGVPIGAALAGEKAAGVFEPGDHGSTFGGNPLSAAAGLAVLEAVDSPAFLAEISRKGGKIMGAIRGWRHPAVLDVRGLGLMTGIDISRDAWPVLEAGIARAGSGECGLLLLSGGQKTLRLLPPYVISDGEIEQGLEILRELLG